MVYNRKETAFALIKQPFRYIINICLNLEDMGSDQLGKLRYPSSGTGHYSQ